MIGFLLKGIVRDPHRSRLPILVVSIGSALTVLLFCWLNGVIGESIEMNARFTTGHVKVMTRPYAREMDQMPLDLSILNADSLTQALRLSVPEMDWAPRIRFGGLMDVPDSLGETRAQGPAIGWAVDLLSTNSREAQRLNLSPSLVTGRLPQAQGEALISDDFAHRFAVLPGDIVTLMGSTMEGSLSFYNFRIAGTLRFGSTAIDRGAIIIDLADAQQAFQMSGAVGEILGFFHTGFYNDEQASRIASHFNRQYASNNDEYAPVMLPLRDEGGMGDYLDYANTIGSIMVTVFVLAMSLVLWNVGLLGGLRRYSEFGLRLAMGEDKRHIYQSLLLEAILIGSIGSVTGTIVGLGAAWYLQEVGIDLSGMMNNSSLMMPLIAKAQITPPAFVIGFIPGLLSMVLGNALSGIGIYKRQTAKLFNELEV